MARRVVPYVVETAGRDKGKRFIITEMSAAQCEAWAMRVLLAVLGVNANIPDNFAEMGTAGVAQLGLKAISGLKFEVARPLLDEMMDCVQIAPDPTRQHFTRDLVEEDIEEVTTRLMLRKEIFSLHLDFLQAVVPSIFPGAPAPLAGE